MLFDFFSIKNTSLFNDVKKSPMLFMTRDIKLLKKTYLLIALSPNNKECQLHCKLTLFNHSGLAGHLMSGALLTSIRLSATR